MKSWLALFMMAALGLGTEQPLPFVQQGKLVWSDEFDRECHWLSLLTHLPKLGRRQVGTTKGTKI